MQTFVPTTTGPSGALYAGPRPLQPQSAGVTTVLVLALAMVASLAGFFGGPALGDHEALVAQTARHMRMSGDWVLPVFLDVPWFRKPPLPYWLVAGASYLFANDPNTGLPVTPAAARLPSALAGLGTILLLWKLAAVMFGPRTGRVTAVMASSTILFLLYSPNATAEMALTFCCVWAYLHFWYVVTARATRRRLWHLFLFYIALGMGMLAKGPAPVAMVGLPLAVWWYTNRPLRILACRGPHATKRALLAFVRGLWPRTVESFTRLWLLPGLVIFGLFFVPWMLIVAGRVPTAWDEWKWQYVMRAQGDYLDSRDRAPWYYLPYVLGFVVPWFFLIPEGLLAPWLKRYARIHRPLLYAGVWAVVAITVMSLESFKKPYYIVPAMPGLILLLAVIAERFYSRPVTAQRWMWNVWAAVAAGLVGGVIGGAIWARQAYPEVSGRLTVIMALLAAGLLVAGAFHIKNRPGIAFGLLAIIAVGTFHSIWHSSGKLLDNLDRAEGMAKALEDLPKDACVLWADGRPDARVDFYFDRRTGYMIKPSEIVGVFPDRKSAKDELKLMALGRARKLLAEPRPIYLIFERGSLEQAKMYGLKAREYRSVRREDPSAKGADLKSKKDWVVVTNQP